MLGLCWNNRDDHSKNFTFIYDEKTKKWKLSPAYDLTYSTTYYGEHTTTVDGNGSNPSKENLLNVGEKVGLDRKHCLDEIEKISTYVNEDLFKYIN